MIREILSFAGGYHFKGLKSMPAREGIAWQGKLYKDRELLGEVGDEGCGGAMVIRLKPEALAALEAHAQEKTSHVEFGGHEVFLEALADLHDTIQRLKRAEKKAPVRIYDEDKNEFGIPVAYSSFKCQNTPANLAAIRRKVPEVRLLADELHLWDLRDQPEALALALTQLDSQTQTATAPIARPRQR